MVVEDRVRQYVEPSAAVLASVSADSVVGISLFRYPTGTAEPAGRHLMGVQPLRLSACLQRRMPVAVVPFRAAVDEGLQRRGCISPCPRSPSPGLRLDCICHIGSPNAGDRLPALGLPHSNHGSPAPTVRLDYTKLAEEGSTDRFTTRMQIRIFILSKMISLELGYRFLKNFSFDASKTI